MGKIRGNLGGFGRESSGESFGESRRESSAKSRGAFSSESLGESRGSFWSGERQKYGAIALEIAFFAAVFVVLIINYHASGGIFKYETNHDHHLAFFTFLSGMAAENNLPGIDFYSPHSVLVPIFIGIFLKFLGISQVHLAEASGIFVFFTMIFLYKTARFCLPRPVAMLSILTLLFNHPGKDIPWFNDTIMLFVAAAVYFLCDFLVNRRRISAIIVGVLVFLLPLMRQQGIVIGALFLVLPSLLFYTHQLMEFHYKVMLKNILLGAAGAAVGFCVFVLLWNGLAGFEILYSSFLPLVDMAQPALPYNQGALDVMQGLLDFSRKEIEWHEYAILLSWWAVVFVVCVYFAYRPFALNADKKAILNEDSVRFVAAVVTLSTVVFHYPMSDDWRYRLSFSIGVWLFVEVLYRAFWHRNAKIISTIFFAFAFLLLNHAKITSFAEKTAANFHNLSHTRTGYVKMGDDTPYAGMKFRESYAAGLNLALDSLKNYAAEHPEKSIIFDGELVEANNFMSLVFGGPKVALAHKFPYVYGGFNRAEFYPTMAADFAAFVEKEKPIALICGAPPKGYKSLVNLNESCHIFVPRE